MIVVGGWSNDGVGDSSLLTEMLDYTQTDSTWVEGNKKTRIQICGTDLKATVFL